MLTQWLTKLGLTAALASSPLLVDPRQDPDVRPHADRGYFMQDENATLASSMTRERSQRITADFLKQFEPRLKAKGLQFSVKVDWSNKWFSAHAQFEQKNSSVVLWGGFLRAPGMNDIIVATTLCHELGHLIAGPPLQTISATDNVSTEGQSDFFAGSCLAEFAQRHPEYFRTISAEVRSFCLNDFHCSAALEGGLQTVRFMQKWGFAPYKPVSLNQKAAPVTQYTPNVYPENQCRLDSFKARALCLKYAKGFCAPPPCWWPTTLEYPPRH